MGRGLVPASSGAQLASCAAGLLAIRTCFMMLLRLAMVGNGSLVTLVASSERAGTPLLRWREGAGGLHRRRPAVLQGRAGGRHERSSRQQLLPLHLLA